MKSVRVVVVAALACAIAFGAAGCTLPTRHSRTDREPVTVTHAFGATTITATPERVVALGDRWLDAIGALGVAPVGRLAPRPGAPTPWSPPAIVSARPLNAAGNVVEQIAALHPDLILLDGLPIDRKTYDELSAVAPTVPAEQSPDAPWRDQIATLGRLLRKQDEAERVVADLDARITAIAGAGPRLNGKTYVTTWLAGSEQLIVLSQPSSASGELFTRLGLRVPDTLAALPAAQGHVVLPPERVDELTADVLLAGYSPGLDESYRQLPGYAELPATRAGTVVFLTTTEIAAVEQPTALSIRYILDKLAPVLAVAR